jgi:leucyl aminopeptidase (aminopeptidase T)
MQLYDDEKVGILSFEMELAVATHKLASDVMRVQKGESVLIVADTASDERIVKATADACSVLGAKATVVWFKTNPVVTMDPPEPVIAAMNGTDVMIEYCVNYLNYSKSYEEMMKKSRVRYICLTGMTVESIVRTIEKVNVPVVVELGDKLVELTRKADKVRVTNSSGTDITGFNRGRPVSQPGGIADKPGPYMLCGQVAWNPVEETINGTIAVDGWEWNVGIIQTPVQIKIEKGRIVDIKGGWEAKRFANWLAGFNDPNVYRLAHYSYGFNPGMLKLTGLQNDDERLFGSLTFGFGTKGSLIGGPGWMAAAHTDCGILNPSVYLDDKAIELDGKYVHPELVKLAKKLEVRGY